MAKAEERKRSEKPIGDIRAEWDIDREYTIAEAREICEISSDSETWKIETLQRVKQLAVYLPDPLLFINPEGPTFNVDKELTESVYKFYHTVLKAVSYTHLTLPTIYPV